jgi:hypothetical protein
VSASSRDAEAGKQASNGLPEKVFSVAPLIVTLLAAYDYVIARYAYEQFYGAFGVTPEDVGLGYAETLTRSSNALIEAVVAGVLLAWSVWTVKQLRRGDGKTNGSGLSGFVRGYLLWIATIAAFVLSALLLTSAHILRGRVLEGKSVRVSTTLTSGWSWATILGVRVHPVMLDWIEGAPPSSVHEAHNHRLMYLGRSGSTVVLYDVDGKRTLRLPEGSVVLTEAFVPRARTR